MLKNEQLLLPTETVDVVALQPVSVLVKVNVAVPVDMPVTTPAFVIVATRLLLLVQVPPVVGVKVMVLPMPTEPAAETTGNGFTVAITAVLEAEVHPLLAASA